LKLLFVGDVVGKAGRQILKQKLPSLIDRHMVDLVVVNAENAAAGYGLTLSVMDELYLAGAQVLTSGNHIWDKREILEVLDRDKRLLRPHNYPKGLAGRGYDIFETAAGLPVAVINLEGRVFMKNLDCPFRAADQILEEVSGQAKMIFVDFHAEATSEKQALGHYLDGRVSAMVGTHTHVQTADEKILKGGTGYLTDAGMTGAQDAVIGNQKEPALQRFLTQLPVRLEVAKNDPLLCAALMTIDEETGRCTAIERVQERP
jgi:metallophosphoesterase (TIGR00282 family)